MLAAALGTLPFTPTRVHAHVYMHKTIHVYTHTLTHVHTHTRMQLCVSSNKVVWKKGAGCAAVVQKVFTSEHKIEQVSLTEQQHHSLWTALS